MPLPTVEQLCRQRLLNASNFQEWKEAAVELDVIEGKDQWKRDPRSDHYDYRLIKSRFENVRITSRTTDTASMMFLLRAGLLRNLGGICNKALYRKTKTGTKVLIEDYIDEMVKHLYGIAKSKDGNLTVAEKTEFFSELLQSYGRTALILHGGSMFGLCHFGVMKTLYEAGLLPSIICGTYVGAIVASVVCVQEPNNLPVFFSGNVANFGAFSRKEVMGSWRRKIVRLLKQGRLLDVRVLEECARENIGDITFKEAYKKSGLVLNISVYSKRKNEVPVLLNYLTAPDVVVWSAACASCTLPGVYDSVTLMTKDNNGILSPWSPSTLQLCSVKVLNELPLQRLTELFNANNFIVSYVPSYWSWNVQESAGYNNSLILSILQCLDKEVRHRLWQLDEIGLIPEWLNRIGRFFALPHGGDMLISPSLYISDMKYFLQNPDKEFMNYCIKKGERAAWKKMAQMRVRCAVEFAIEDISKNMHRLC